MSPDKIDDARLRIAVRLRQARLSAGLTQAQVSKMLGLHRPSVTEFEAGRRRVGADELKQLADLYHVSVAWLTRDEDEVPDMNSLRMAARELSTLSEGDLERLMDAIRMIKAKNG